MRRLSLSQLQLYEHCPRKHFYRYSLNLADPPGIEASFSTHLIHKPITDWYSCLSQDWGAYWIAFKRDTELVANTPTYRTAFYTLELAQFMFEAYTKTYPVDFNTVESTEKLHLLFKHEDIEFVVKPDVVLGQPDPMVIELKASQYDYILQNPGFNRQLVAQSVATNREKVSLRLLNLKTRKILEQLICVTLDHKEEFMRELLYSSLPKFNISQLTGIWEKHSPGACIEFNRLCVFSELCLNHVPRRITDLWPKRDPRPEEVPLDLLNRRE